MNVIKKHDQFQKLFLNTVHPFSVGFDTFFYRLNTSMTACYPSTTFPPYNIAKEDNKTYIELALAGYTKEDVKFLKEQPTERLRLIFIDMFKARYADYRVREERIEITNIYKSNSPFEEVAQ